MVAADPRTVTTAEQLFLCIKLGMNCMATGHLGNFNVHATTTLFRLSALLWFLCAASGSFMTAAAADIKVGTAMQSITPDPLLPVPGGLGPSSPVRDKRGELTARAVVFRNGRTSLAVVSLDLLGFPAVLCDRVRSLVPRIAAKNILIGSTHGHSSPDCYVFPDGRGGHTGDLAYIDMVCQKAAEAVNQAIDSQQPAWIKVATGEARGKIAYNDYAPDLYDRRMSVIQAVSPGGQTIA